ncbi:hypothetical protein ACHQM5_017790 [Ranunculus cassubicifolius]
MKPKVSPFMFIISPPPSLPSVNTNHPQIVKNPNFIYPQIKKDLLQPMPRIPFVCWNNQISMEVGKCS